MKKFTILLLVLSGLLVAVFFLALTQGAADIPLITIKEAFTHLIQKIKPIKCLEISVCRGSVLRLLLAAVLL